MSQRRVMRYKSLDEGAARLLLLFQKTQLISRLPLLVSSPPAPPSLWSFHYPKSDPALVSLFHNSSQILRHNTAPAASFRRCFS